MSMEKQGCAFHNLGFLPSRSTPRRPDKSEGFRMLGFSQESSLIDLAGVVLFASSQSRVTTTSGLCYCSLFTPVLPGVFLVVPSCIRVPCGLATHVWQASCFAYSLDMNRCSSHGPFASRSRFEATRHYSRSPDPRYLRSLQRDYTLLHNKGTWRFSNAHMSHKT